MASAEHVDREAERRHFETSRSHPKLRLETLPADQEDEVWYQAI